MSDDKLPSDLREAEPQAQMRTEDSAELAAVENNTTVVHAPQLSHADGRKQRVPLRDTRNKAHLDARRPTLDAMQPSCDPTAPATIHRARARLKHTIAALACIPSPETLESRGSSALVAKCLRDIEALINAVRVETRNAPAPEPLNHYWTPDPSKRFCVICGDNGLGSVWGIHRFQIQPHDPDFGSGTQPSEEHADPTRRSEAPK